MLPNKRQEFVTSARWPLMPDAIYLPQLMTALWLFVTPARTLLQPFACQGRQTDDVTSRLDSVAKIVPSIVWDPDLRGKQRNVTWTLCYCALTKCVRGRSQIWVVSLTLGLDYCTYAIKMQQKSVCSIVSIISVEHPSSTYLSFQKSQTLLFKVIS